jgi:hypothetical protein
MRGEANMLETVKLLGTGKPFFHDPTRRSLFALEARRQGLVEPAPWRVIDVKLITYHGY